MQKLIVISSLLLSGLAQAGINQSGQVPYQCADQGLAIVLDFMGETEEEFFSHSDEIFSCRSKEEPRVEIYQWGDGSGLVGIEFKIENGQCIVTEEPYTGQDDQDADWDWVEEYCM